MPSPELVLLLLTEAKREALGGAGRKRKGVAGAGGAGADRARLRGGLPG
jgi:hypothetical protein